MNRDWLLLIEGSISIEGLPGTGEV